MPEVWSERDDGMARARSIQDKNAGVSVNTFHERVAVAKTAEQRVTGLLLWNHKAVYKVGLENLLPEWLHSAFKFTNGEDEFLRTFRHLPDLATDRVLIQVKSAPNERGYAHVVIEVACYEACMRISDYGVPVLVVWMFADGSLHAAWVNDLRVILSEGSEKGSGTRMALVGKSQLHPMREYLKEL